MSFDLDKRSKVTNLCPWPVTFILPNSHGEVRIDGSKSTTINNAELVTMKDNNSVMLCGTENGNHARIYVDNPEFRQYVGFDVPDEKMFQFVLLPEECEKICGLKTDTAFQKNVKEKVILEHEKSIIMDYCRKTKFNDYAKIIFLEEYTGLKL